MTSNKPQGDTTINSEHIAAKYVNRQQWAGSTNRIRIELASDIDRLIAQEAKAFGGCRICYGKGYATVRKGTTAKGKTWGLRTHINYCSCDRGKQLQQVVSQEANKARETDEYGNPMIQLNMYEAKAVMNLLNRLREESDHSYDTGDWFLDVPRKIAQRLAKLTSEKESSNEL